MICLFALTGCSGSSTGISASADAVKETETAARTNTETIEETEPFKTEPTVTETEPPTTESETEEETEVFLNDSQYVYGIDAEQQGTLARVQRADDLWDLVHIMSGTVLISECREIMDVSDGGAAMTAVDREGHVLLLSYDHMGPEIKTVKKYDEFVKATEVINNDFVIVSDGEKKGVIDAFNGNVVVPSKYDCIEYDQILDKAEEGFDGAYVFVCRDGDHSETLFMKDLYSRGM